MATRRVIKKVEKQIEPTFDELLWPVYGALVVLGCYLLGIVLAVCKFNDANPLRNAFTWLIAIPVVMIGAALLVQRIESQVVRRGVILSALLSLIIHVTIFLMMAFMNIFSSVPDRSVVASQPEEQREVITVPDMLIPLPPEEQEVQDHERPVESGEPEESEDLLVEREQQSPVPQPQEEMAEPEQDSQEEEPTPQLQRQVAETAPRRSEFQATISRSEVLTRPTVATGSTQVANANPNTDLAQTRPRDTQAVQKQAPELPQRQTTDQPESTRPSQTPRMAQRQQQNEAPTPMSRPAPTLPRASATPNITPRTSVTRADRPSQPKQTNEDTLQPAAVAQQREATSPSTNRDVTEPAPESISLNVRQAPERQQRAEPNPELAITTESTNSRRAVTVRPDVRTEVSDSQVASTESATETLSPSSNASQVTRQSSQTPESQRASAAPPAETESTPAPSTVARSESAESPAPIANQPRSDNPRRSSTEANVVSSPAPVEVASQSNAASESASQLQASATALSQSRSGVAGVGVEANLDQSTPAPANARPTIASASARRATAAQDEPGPAISPQQASEQRQTRAGAAAPNAIMPSQDVAVAQVVGSETPSDLQASASAAATQSRANAPRGVTGTPGPTEVDLGPTRIIANTGSGRASGGGQPTLNFNPSPNKVVRSDAGAGARPQINAANVSPVAQAPISGGDEEQAIEPTANASSEIASRAGGSPDQRLPATGEANLAAPTGSNRSDQVTAQLPARASSIDAPENAIAEAGGGTSRPTRQMQQRPSAVLTPSAEVDLAGLLESSGEPAGATLQAQGTQATRSAGGIAAATTNDKVGNLSDEAISDGKAEFVSQMFAAMERSSATDEDGPSPADLIDRGGPIGRNANVPLPSIQASDIAATFDMPSNTPDGAEAGGPEQVADARSGPMSKQTAGSIPVEVNAPDGPGGLAADLSVDVGVMTRQAQTESNVVAFNSARFLRSDTGRPLPKSTSDAVSTPAFQRRQVRTGEDIDGGDGRPSPKTDAAIELGLVYLSKNQLEAGNWSLHRTASGRPASKAERPALRSDTAATGLSLLCFFGAGYHHKEDKYAEPIRAGLEYLIENQRADGNLYVAQDRLSNQSGWMYSHAIATISLCEAYGMTQDPALREPAQRAINFIVTSQHPERGGWRYRPKFGSDTSVSGWMMMALKSGRLAKLEVPEKTFDEVKSWLDLAQASPDKPHLYRYNPYAPANNKQSHGREVSRTMTAVGLLMRFYSGWSRDTEAMKKGAEYLLESPPTMGTSTDRQRDTYYWYYATQVMFHMGGDYWKRWNKKLHPLLAETQVQEGQMAGSWSPLTPVPDRWGPHAGRLYVTTMNLLSLEVYYRHLPIYEETAQ